MLTKDEVLASILKECDIAAHLATKIPADGLDFRPTEGQRSNAEVLHYLSFCAIGGALFCIEGKWDSYGAWEAKQADITPANAAEKFAAQKAALTEAFGQLTDADMARSITHPMGFDMPLNQALLELPLKWMVGYRMQLFLGAKAAGNDEIWTPDCWHGVSRERPEASAS